MPSTIRRKQKYFSDRVLYYASFAIQQQSVIVKEKLEKEAEEIKKRWNYNINKVYVVCVLNYRMDTVHPEKFRWDVVRMDRELKEPFSETLNEVYLEMPKFVLPLSACDTIYKKWLYVLNNINIMERLPEELNNQIFQKLKSIVEVERMSVDERLEYELSLSVERDLSAALEASFEDGEAKGVEKGIERGRNEAHIQAAITMKQLGLSMADIEKVTGLTAEEIEQL